MVTNVLQKLFAPADKASNHNSHFDFALRAIEVAMGFIFLMGGWRRFYNVPLKHDIESGKHLAGKLVQAAPGSPLEDIIHWVLYNPLMAEMSVYFMSMAEVIVGICLIIGLMTRLAGVGSALLNVAMMLIFGWMGYECLDEYTMAALGFAISISIIIYGSGGFSLDQKFGIDPFKSLVTRKLAISLMVISIVFTVGFYSYYFGIFNFKKLTHTKIFNVVAEKTEQKDVFTLYVNSGGSSGAAYVTSIIYTMANGATLKQLPSEIKVLHSHFEPWSHGSGKVKDGVMKLILGSKVDISVPASAVSAKIKIIDNGKKVPEVSFK